MNEFESFIINVIAYSGESKKFSVQALAAAKRGEFAEAEKWLKKSHDSLKTANTNSFELMQKEVGSESFKVSLLMVHALDHLSSAEEKMESTEELIELLKIIDQKWKGEKNNA